MEVWMKEKAVENGWDVVFGVADWRFPLCYKCSNFLGKKRKQGKLLSIVR
jgi:hypothetical protein